MPMASRPTCLRTSGWLSSSAPVIHEQRHPQHAASHVVQRKAARRYHALADSADAINSWEGAGLFRPVSTGAARTGRWWVVQGSNL